MSPEDLLPPSHRRPRLPGDDSDSDSDDPIESGPSTASGAYDDTLMIYADDERDDDDDEDDDEEEDDEEEDDDDAGDFCYGNNHHHQHQQPQYFVHQQFLYPPDAYPSDDLDMSDDGGAPLVNYLDVVNLLTNDINMSAGFGSDGGYGFFGGGGGGHLPLGIENQYTPAQNDGLPPPDDSSVAEPTYNFPSVMPHQPAVQTPPPMNPTTMPQQLEMFVDDMDDDAFAVWFPGGHPVALSNPNPNTLGPGNYGLVDFLKHWAGQSPGLQGLPRERGKFPWTSKINDQAQTHLTHVQYADLEGDQCDFQGIDWEDLGVTRREARERRLLTYTNYVNRAGSDRWSVSSFPPPSPCSEAQKS